jgi:hypothetical protein
LQCDRFRFFDAPELGECCRQHAAGCARARNGLHSATCGFESFKRRGAVMFGYRYDISAKGQRRRIVAAIGQSGARMRMAASWFSLLNPPRKNKT